MGKELQLKPGTVDPSTDFDQQVLQATAKTPGVVGGTPLQALTDPAAGFDSQIESATTKTNGQVPQFDLSAAVNKYLEPVKLDFDKHYQNGAKAMVDGLNYADVIYNDKTLDEVKSLAQAQDETPDLTPIGGAIAPLAESLPAFRKMVENAAVAAAAGGAIGGATGLAGGPFAEVTVPGGALAGASWGGSRSMALTSGEIAAGNALKEMTDAGVPLDKAKAFAIPAGLIIGGLQLTGVGQVGKTIMAHVVKESTAGAVKDSLLKGVAKQYLKNAGIIMGDAALQNWTGTIATAIGKAQSNIQTKDLPQRLGQDFAKAVALALAAGIVPAVGSAIAGKLTAIHKTPHVDNPHIAAKTVSALLNDEELPDLEAGMPMSEFDKALKANTEKQKQKEKFEADQKKLFDDAKAIRDDVLEGAKTTKTGKLSDTLSEPESKSKNLAENIVRAREAFTFDMEGKLDTLLQHLSKAQRKAIWKKLDPVPALDAVRTQIEQQQEIFHHLLQETTGLRAADAVKLLAKSGKDELEIPYTDKSGAPAVFKGTVREALGLKLDMEHVNPDQPNPVAGIHRQGWTYKKDLPNAPDTSLQHQIDLALHQYHPAMAKIGEAIKTYYEKHNKPILQKAVLNDTGKPLTEKTNGPGTAPVYSGQIVRRGVLPSFENFINSIGGTVNSFVKEVAEPGASKDMVHNNIHVERRDPIVGVYQAISNTAHYDNMTDLGKTYNIVFNDPNVIKAAKIQHGGLLINELRGHADQVVNGLPNTAALFVKKVNKWMSDYGHAILAADPKRYAMHALQATSYGLADIGGGRTLPVSSLIKGIISYHKDPAKVNDFLYKNIEGLRTKYASPGNNALAGVVRESDEAVPIKKGLSDFLGGFLTKGAQYCDNMGVHSVYEHMVNVEKVSQAEALKVAAEALHDVQYTNNPAKLSTYALNPHVKGFGAQFTQYPTAMAQHRDIAIRDLMNKPGWGTAAGAAKAIAIVHLSEILFVGVNTALVYADANSTAPEKDNSLWQLVGKAMIGPQPLMVGPIVHDAISAAHMVHNRIEHAKDPDVELAHEHMYGFSFMPVEAVTSTVKGAMDLEKIREKKEAGEEIKTSDWVGAYLNIARGVLPQLRRTVTPVAVYNKKLKKDDKDNAQ